MSRLPRCAAFAMGVLVAVLGLPASVASARPAVQAQPSSGCRAARVTRGDRHVTMSSGGVTRGYFRRVPPSARPHRPLPLVVDLHGYLEPAAAHKATSALGPFGDAHGFVTVTPEGSTPGPRWDTRADSADMTFIGDLLGHVVHSTCIDLRRVYMDGYSNGAFMTSSVVCAYGDRVAAVAAVSGIRAVPGCTPTRPMPVVAFHGTADEFVRFTGGYGASVDALPEPDHSETLAVAAPSDSGLSVPDVAAAWAKRNGCPATSTTRAVASDVTEVRYACPRAADVELYEIAGAGHTWPGSKFAASLAKILGPTSFSINADAVMWRFFRQHPLPKPAPHA
jgi:polyhydroxybutyrate depolymerase